jgi:hypothetical protein
MMWALGAWAPMLKNIPKFYFGAENENVGHMLTDYIPNPRQSGWAAILLQKLSLRQHLKMHAP